MEAQGTHTNVARALKGRYPDVERDVLEFIGFVRNERLPVTLSLIQTRALLSAEVRQHNNFKASRGWVAKFLRRTGVQPSLRLHGKGGTEVTNQTLERMEEIRSIAAEYSLHNIYNQDESGLFYRMGPNRTYLGKDETRSSARGTSFQKYKKRLTVVFGANASGKHILPIRYIGVSKSPACFRNQRHLKSSYTSQRYGWMDTTGFDQWIRWWHSEVKERSNGPWLLLVDNCGGHFSTQNLPGVRIEKLPPNTTCKFQPLDQGLIEQSKIRYRSLLLRHTCEIVEKKRSGNHNFKKDSQRGLYGLREGQLPHVVDAIRLFDDSWNQTSKATVLKCWIKSKCLPAMLEGQATSTVRSLTETCIDLVQDKNGTDDMDLSIPNAVDFEDVRELEDIIAVLNFMNPREELPTSPEQRFVQQVISRCSTGNLHNFLNTPDSLDNGRLQDNTPENEF